jgi:tripartite-type tricarboxylate transporter receptor subunit TctC
MRHGARLAAAAAMVGVAGSASAQNYPDHVVEIILPTTPGSSADILGRVLADGLASQLGKPFIIINKPGASGVIGSAAVANAKPDGYTLMHGATFSITVQPLTDKQAGYTYKSFDPICQTFKNDQVLVVPPNSPLKTVRDIIEAAKKKPGALNVGIPGTYTIPHLAMIELSQQAKVEFNDIPFKGPAEEIQMTRGGQLDFASVPLTAAAGSGLHMPAIFATARNPSIPDVPTAKEQGFDVAPLSFGGLLGPAGLPVDVKRKLADACTTTMRGEAAQRIDKTTFQPPDSFADSAGFARNLDLDVAEKTRLLSTIKAK